MRFIAEHQRNIAFDLLRIKRRGLSLTKCFVEKEPVMIYGLGFLGKELYSELKGWVNVTGFIDRAHDMEFYEDVPVFSIDNTNLTDMFQKNKKVKIIVTVLSAWNEISNALKRRFSNAVPLSMYSLTSFLKLEYFDNINSKQGLAIEIVRNMIFDKEVTIDKIVLVGTSYTELLSILILPNWQNTLYIAERFFPASIVKKMTEFNIPCLYEEEPGEFYDITYLIAEYAIRKKIPIYGHDHMALSRAFFKNPINVIEDGDANYDFRHAETYKNFLDNGEKYLPFGFHESVSKVILTGLMDIPAEIAGKVECINPSQLWDRKSEIEKKLISYIFHFPYLELLDMVRDGRDILFLTEAYAHVNGDNVVSIEKVISLYRKILANYDKKKIIIKPHPSDCIRYEQFMPEYCTISKNFPIQLIKWSGIPIKKVVLMHGTTCMHVFKEGYDVDVYNKNYFNAN